MEWTVILLFAIGLVAYLAKVLVEKGMLDYSYARKALHVFAIGASAFSVYIVDNQILFWLVAGLTPILFLMVITGFFDLKNEKRNNWGIFYFSLIFLALLWLFPHQNEMVFFPLLVLALSDGLATVVGRRFGKHHFTFGYETKSVEGSSAFFISTFLILFLLPRFFAFLFVPFASIYAVLIISVFLTFLEAISIKGRDNLWIPIALIYWLSLDTFFIDQWYFLVLLGVGTIVFITYKLKWISSGGALAVSILGWFLVISPHPKVVLPFCFFFAIGSLLSKISYRKSEREGEPRTANQVFYNGGVAAFLLGLYFISSQLVFFIAGMASLAAALSDTVASEIGVRWAGKTVNITTAKSVEPGLSGGISFLGTLAGMIVAVVFALFVSLIFGSFSLKYFLIIAGIGLLGNIVDSLAGSLLQIKYRESSDLPWRDFPARANHNEKRGFSFITNDVVNLIATGFAGIAGGLIFMFL